jgi:outer membrane biosynthesis protein TonB
VISATQEEFGWAAATAVSQWVFKIPLRAGQPADVRVRIPFDFKVPVD